MGIEVIKDPTVIGYAFFFRWLEDEDEPKRAERESHFATVIQETWVQLLHWLGRKPIPLTLAEQAQSLGSNPSHPALPADRHCSYLVTRMNDPDSADGWLRSSDKQRAAFLEARTYDDVFTVEVGRSQLGEHPLAAFAQLRGEGWLPATQHGFLGTAYCLAGKVSGEAGLAPAALRSWGVEQAKSSAFRSGWIGRPVEDLSPLVLLYSTDEEEAAVGALWHGPILGLFLQRCKAGRIIQEHEEIYRRAEARKREVRESVQLAAPPVNDLHKLEVHLDTLTVCYTQLSGLRMAIQRQCGTLGVSLRNMEMHVTELQQESLSLDEDFFAPIIQEYRRGEEQMHVDLTYLVTTLQEAETILQAVDTGVDIERGKIEQLANIVLGVIAVLLAVGQAVDSEMARTILSVLGYASPSDLAITFLRLSAMVVFAVLTLVVLVLLTRGKRRPRRGH